MTFRSSRILSGSFGHSRNPSLDRSSGDRNLDTPTFSEILIVELGDGAAVHRIADAIVLFRVHCHERLTCPMKTPASASEKIAIIPIQRSGDDRCTLVSKWQSTP